jgi:glucose-1-phosphate cytidylyltransferase
MKVVLFCGGQGMRLREYSDSIPKPMVPIGYRPILWHVMKYYAHFGHKDFILCLGHRADAIKDYFLNYDECVSNDFTLSHGAKKIELAQSDIHDWRITFVDTGIHANIGQRLLAVRGYLDGEEAFLANYADNVSDLPLPEELEFFRVHQPVGLFLSVRPSQSFHVVDAERDGKVRNLVGVENSNIWINGGYFVFRHDLFDYMQEGEELVLEPFQRLIRDGKLMTYRYEGFWACLDTFKEKQRLDELDAQRKAVWQVWNPACRPSPPAPEELNGHGDVKSARIRPAAV